MEGLKHIHDQEIMHRDIKLENILFKKQNQIDSVVLADFGLATNVNESVYLYCRCGTPGYLFFFNLDLLHLKLLILKT